MSLRYKTLFLLAAVFAVSAALDYGVQRYVIAPSFLAVERNEAGKDVSRCVEALNRECHHLDRVCQDWAAWDDAYRFVQDRNEAFVKSALPDETFREIRLNVVYFFDSQGRAVWSRVLDMGSWKPIQVEDISDGSIFRQFLPHYSQHRKEAVAGILMTRKGPMLVAARDIVTSKKDGPSHGVLVMGRFLEKDTINVLREQTCVDFTVSPLGRGEDRQEKKIATGLIAGRSPVHFEAADDKVLRGYTLISDIYDRPVLMLRADMPRDIVATGRTADTYALVSILGVGLIVSLVALCFLQRFIVGPVTKLTDHIMAIAGSKSLSLRVPLEYGGEIGTLAREFNTMLQQLSHARQRLLEQSYYTGLAEMSTGTLDHIHAALDPLITQVENLRKELAIGGETDKVKCLEDVVGRASSIHETLIEHERFREADRLVEDIPLDALVRESTDLVPDDLLATVSVEMDFDPAQTPAVKGYRILLLQVFSNLFMNSAESIRRCGLAQGTVNIGVDFEQDNGKDMVHVKFVDNGEGIDPDQVAHIFDRGYTTKASRKEAPFLGLHWCASALGTMGGRAFAESEGPGKGACFHVILPAGPVLVGQTSDDIEVSESAE